MVLVMCRLARRLTGSTMLGCVAGLLLSLDGLHFVLSRLALLDIFLAFFLLCARAPAWSPTATGTAPRWRAWSPSQVDRPRRRGGPCAGCCSGPGCSLGGVCCGLAIGTKWTALFPLAAFGLLAWLWSAGARRSFGVRWPLLRSAVVDGLPAFVPLVLVALVVYIATWTGWLVHAHEYEEHLSSTQYTRFSRERPCKDGETENTSTTTTAGRPRREPDASGVGEVVQSLRSLWYYHQDVYTFHTHFLNCSEHAYASKPSGWLLINRPVGVAADTRTSSPAPGLRRARRAATACGRCC